MMKKKYARFYLIVFSALAITIFTIGVIPHKTIAVQDINNTNMTSKTPINVVDVIKAGEKSINSQLDKARQAIQANNDSEALRIIEDAKQDVGTLSICATSAIK
jgi:hypothetical protein